MYCKFESINYLCPINNYIMLVVSRIFPVNWKTFSNPDVYGFKLVSVEHNCLLTVGPFFNLNLQT